MATLEEMVHHLTSVSPQPEGAAQDAQLIRFPFHYKQLNLSCKKWLLPGEGFFPLYFPVTQLAFV